MRKILFALVGVSLIGFGLRTEGEGAIYPYCISEIGYYVATPGKTRVTVRLGSDIKYLIPTPDGMIVTASTFPVKPEHYLTYGQLAAFEPILASLRASVAAKVMTQVSWDTSTGRVNSVYVLFNAPCK